MAEEGQGVLRLSIDTVYAVLLPHIAVRGEEAVKALPHAVVGRQEVGVLRDRGGPPKARVHELRMRGAVGGHDVPRDVFVPGAVFILRLRKCAHKLRRFRDVDAGGEFFQPRHDDGLFLKYVQAVLRRLAGSAERRGIDVAGLQIAYDGGQCLGFPPALLGQCIRFVIRVSVSDEQ